MDNIIIYTTGKMSDYWLENQSLKSTPHILRSEVAKRLCANLPIMKIEPKTILCQSRDNVFLVDLLKQYYPNATIYTDDDVTRHRLSFNDHSIDMIVSNLYAHWHNDVVDYFQQCRRLLRSDGLLLFSMLGRDTLYELYCSFKAAGCLRRVHRFMDMHDVGDVLLKLRFSGPIMETEHITLTYNHPQAICRDLQQMDSQNKRADRPRALTGKQFWQTMLTAYEQFSVDGLYPATYEVIYGHAWMIQQQITHQNNHFTNEIAIDVSDIKNSS